jgi:hypothetical protein
MHQVESGQGHVIYSNISDRPELQIEVTMKGNGSTNYKHSIIPGIVSAPRSAPMVELQPWADLSTDLIFRIKRYILNKIPNPEQLTLDLEGYISQNQNKGIYPH